MSSTKYILEYEDNSSDISRKRKLYVHHFNTMDMTTIYNETGDIVLSWMADTRGKADLISKVIREELKDSDMADFDRIEFERIEALAEHRK